MIDVLLVLLIIFMAALPTMRKSVDVQLPIRIPRWPRRSASNQIVLEVNADGLLDQLREGRRGRLGPGSRRSTIRAREDHLREGDPEVKYEQVVHAMDVSRGSGVKVIGVPPKDTPGRGQVAGVAAGRSRIRRTNLQGRPPYNVSCAGTVRPARAHRSQLAWTDRNDISETAATPSALPAAVGMPLRDEGGARRGRIGRRARARSSSCSSSLLHAALRDRADAAGGGGAGRLGRRRGDARDRRRDRREDPVRAVVPTRCRRPRRFPRCQASSTEAGAEGRAAEAHAVPTLRSRSLRRRPCRAAARWRRPSRERVAAAAPTVGAGGPGKRRWGRRGVGTGRGSGTGAGTGGGNQANYPPVPIEFFLRRCRRRRACAASASAPNSTSTPRVA
jgi:biopolymer transport protein ExbD